MIFDFPTRYDSSITYYGLGYTWVNYAGTPGAAPPGNIGGYRTLMGLGF